MRNEKREMRYSLLFDPFYLLIRVNEQMSEPIAIGLSKLENGGEYFIEAISLVFIP